MINQKHVCTEAANKADGLLREAHQGVPGKGQFFGGRRPPPIERLKSGWFGALSLFSAAS